MASEEDKQATNSTKLNLHPVYTVSNIQHKVRVLDGTKVTYDQWVKLFTLHAKGYKVLDHINGTPPTYESWSEIDAHVLQWIYGTLSDDLLARVLEDESTALQAWNRVKNIFLNNKGSQSSAALEHEFDNLKLESMPSLDAYCQKLRELAGQLKDVDTSVTEERLVRQLVRGLPPAYDTVASYIHQTLPNFETAHRMLQLEQHRKAARDTPSSTEVLVAPSSPTRDATKLSEQPKGTSHNNRGNGSRKNSQRESNSRGGRNNQGVNTAPVTPDSTPAAQWVPNPLKGPSPSPPFPYPTASRWVQPWHGPWPSPFPPPHTRPQSTHPWPYPGQQQAQAYITELGARTDLNSEFEAISIQEEGDGQWFMDTGASSHLTSDAGTSDWNYDYEEQ